MSGNLLYAVATLAIWAGWFCAYRAVVAVVKLLSKDPGADTARLSRSLALAAGGAAVLFLFGSMLPKTATAPATEGWRFPVFWFVMPFPAWLCVTSVVMAAVRAVQAGLSLNPKDKGGRLRASVIWVVTAAVGYWLYKRDPADKIEALGGGISFQPTTAVGLVLLAVAATVAMVLAGRSAVARGYARAAVTQLALVTGSVVFGIPFLFLLITSLKEPQDMSSPDGIVWIPKVSETVPYFDKKDPEYRADYKGDQVTADIIGRNPDGSVQLNVLSPHGMAGIAFSAMPEQLKEVPKDAKLVQGTFDEAATIDKPTASLPVAGKNPGIGGTVVSTGRAVATASPAATEPASGIPFTGKVIEEMEDGRRLVQFDTPRSLAGKTHPFAPADVQAIRKVGLNWRNYPDALEYLPPEADHGLVYLKNTLIIVILSVLGTLLSSAIVAYAFSRMNFPGRNVLFGILLSTMMLPAAVTLLPTFLIFRQLHTIDTLIPLWAPAFFGSAFNIFLLRQFFMQIPMELEDAAKIDGCTYLKTFWDIMMPQIKPALAVIAIWTFMGAWNNFMGPLIYISSPEHMPLSYALQLFNGDRGNDEPGLVMAFATMCMAPVLLLFFFAQRYFIEGVTLSGLGGR